MTHALRTGTRKSFGEQQVLDGVGLTPKGAILGLLGPNGAGKSTLIRSIMGIVEPDGGTIELDGTPADTATVRRIGYLPRSGGCTAT